MAEQPRDIPFIKEIMSLRMKMKANPQFAAAVRKAIADASGIPAEALASAIIVHPEEVATTEAVGTLPVGSQCQAW